MRTLVCSLFLLSACTSEIQTQTTSEALSTSSLRIRDVTAANRTATLTGTEYFTVQTEPTLWQNGREVFLLSANSKFAYDYPGRSFDGYLAVGHTFNTSAAVAYTVNLGYVDSAGTARGLDVFFPAFTTTAGRKMIFYVATDGSTYYGDREHDGVNQQTELMTPSEAFQAQHIARARPVITGAWTPMAASPLAPRFGHVADAYASEMIVWGGTSSTGTTLYDGAIYNPTSDTWRTLTAPPPGIQGRSGHAIVFSGKGPAIVVWGGVDSNNLPRNDGSMLDLNTNQWVKIPGAPIPARSNASINWGPNGDVIVWGGDDRADGAVWNVFTKTWRTIPPAPIGRTGAIATQAGASSVVFYGGTNAGVVQTTGIMFDLANNGWSSTFDPGLGQRSYLEAVHGDLGAPFYFGGISPIGGQLDDGVLPLTGWVTGPWETVASPGAMFGGRYGAGAWRGREGYCVIGGKGVDVELAANAGGCWSSMIREWQPIPWMPGAHEMRAYPGVAYTYDNVMVWGGHNRTAVLATGWVYRY